MPGLIGFVKDVDPQQATDLLQGMTKALEPESRFGVHLYQEGPLGLGRVSLGILNPEPQPIWNEDKSVCIFMEGEIYDYQEMKGRLVKGGYRFTVDNDAEFALHMYEEHGEDFAVNLNGAFVIAIWDRRSQKLLITNDRLGLHPLYYAEMSSGLIFASGVRALLADSTLSRQVDRVAMEQFLIFDHVLGDRTLLSAAKLFPQASVMTYANGQLRTRRYWNLKYAETYPLRNADSYVEELKSLMRQAVCRQAQGDASFGLLLSGGMDSRYLLGLLAECPLGEPLRTFTFGVPGCDDARYSKELANAARSRHHFFELKPDWLLSQADEAVRITDGLGNIVNLHALATAQEESRYARVVQKGFLGDAMFGFALRPRFWADYDDDTRIQAHLQTHRDQGVINLEEDDRKALFTEGFRRAVGNGTMEAYKAGMGEANSSQLAIQRLYFDLRQRVPRMTINGVEVVRSYMAVRLPYADNDLVDFSTQLPPGYHYRRELVHRAFIEEYPSLAKIPCTPSNLPMIACFREVYLRGRALAQWHLQAKGLGRIAGPSMRPYKDYNNWFRTVLRGWIEDTLLGAHATQRDYYNPQFVRSLVAEHMAGADYAIRLGALLSLELWHRQFID
jgi:asparagine synthase (glutamine-hydrolysing)